MFSTTRIKETRPRLFDHSSLIVGLTLQWNALCGYEGDEHHIDSVCDVDPYSSRNVYRIQGLRSRIFEPCSLSLMGFRDCWPEWFHGEANRFTNPDHRLDKFKTPVVPGSRYVR